MRNTAPTIVITGSTGGIGLHTAIGVAKTGARVVVTGRNRARGEAAVARIRAEADNPHIDLAIADLSTLAGVHALADDLTARLDRIDVLINNAGLLAPERTVNDDGFERNFAVNVVAPYALTQALAPLLEAAKPARVINVTGGLPFDALDPDNLQAESDFIALPSYSRSKRAMEAASLAQAKALEPRGIYLNIVYPGSASTAMTGTMTPSALPWYARPLWPLFVLMKRDDDGKSAAKAARSSVFAATSDALDAVSGRYYDTHSKPAKLHASVRDTDHQAHVVRLIQDGLQRASA